MRRLALALALLLLTGEAAAAPRTGELSLEQFDIVFTKRAEGAAAALSRVIGAQRADLARRMGRDYPGTTKVLVGDGPAELQALAPPGVVPPSWAAGIALPSRNTLLFDARALRSDNANRIVLHELAHLALGRTGAGLWPRWFQEGFAMMVAGEWSVARYSAMYRASLEEQAIPLSALSDSWPDGLSEVEIAYAQSFSFVSWLYEEGGDERFRRLIAAVSAGHSFEDAFREVYEADSSSQEQLWRATLSSRYSWVPVVTDGGLLWVLTTLILLAGYLRLRRRRRERLMAMELEEQARDAALRLVAAEEAQSSATPLGDARAGPDDLLH